MARMAGFQVLAMHKFLLEAIAMPEFFFRKLQDSFMTLKLSLQPSGQHPKSPGCQKLAWNVSTN